jgi:hypothetical protein
MGQLDSTCRAPTRCVQMRHRLKTAWFQPLNLSNDILVSSLLLSNATCTATTYTLNFKPWTLNPKPQTLNPKARAVKLATRQAAREELERHIEFSRSLEVGPCTLE